MIGCQRQVVIEGLPTDSGDKRLLGVVVLGVLRYRWVCVGCVRWIFACQDFTHTQILNVYVRECWTKGKWSHWSCDNLFCGKLWQILLQRECLIRFIRLFSLDWFTWSKNILNKIYFIQLTTEEIEIVRWVNKTSDFYTTDHSSLPTNSHWCLLSIAA